MTLTWGGVSGHLRVGLNIYPSGTEIVCSVYISTDSNGYNWTGSDNIVVKVNGPGSNDASWNVNPNLTDPYEQMYVGQVRFEANPSTSYSFTGSASGLHSGGTPSHTDSGTSNGVPNKPSTPTASSITAHDARIDWSMPSDNGVAPTSVRIQLDNNSNFSSPIADYYDSNPPSYPFDYGSGFTGSPYTLYYVRIAGHVSGFGTGPWSSTRSFRLLAEKPNAPGQPSISSVSSSGATASWGDPSNWGGDNTSDFDVQIATNSSFSGASTYTVYNANSRAFTGLSPYTTYYVRVRAFNSAGDGSWSSSRSFRTDANAPNAPGSLSTTGVGPEEATANWGNPSNWGGNNTDDYKVYLSTNSNMSGATTYTVYNTNSKKFTGLTPGETYYWRVRGFNAGGDGSYSSTMSFTTPGVPTAPRNLQVDNPGPIGATLTWDDPSAWNGQDSGDFEVAWKVSGGSWTYVKVYNVNSYTIPQTLQPNTTYEWTVRAFNSFGNGPYATPYQSWSTSAPPVYVKKSGVWRATVGTYVKKSGVWRTVVRTWVKKNGTWR